MDDEEAEEERSAHHLSRESRKAVHQHQHQGPQDDSMPEEPPRLGAPESSPRPNGARTSKNASAGAPSTAQARTGDKKHVVDTVRHGPCDAHGGDLSLRPHAWAGQSTSRTSNRYRLRCEVPARSRLCVYPLRPDRPDRPSKEEDLDSGRWVYSLGLLSRHSSFCVAPEA